MKKAKLNSDEEARAAYLKEVEDEIAVPLPDEFEQNFMTVFRDAMKNGNEVSSFPGPVVYSTEIGRVEFKFTDPPKRSVRAVLIDSEEIQLGVDALNKMDMILMVKQPGKKAAERKAEEDRKAQLAKFIKTK